MPHKIHSDEVQLYRRTTKDGEHPPYGFKHLTHKDTLFRKPTLLCCGGMFCNRYEHEGLKNSNGYAKFGHGLLSYPQSFPLNPTQSYKSDIDIVSAYYPQHSSALTVGHHDYMKALKENRSGDPSLFAQKFAQQHFFPLVEDADKALPLDTIKRNLRNIHVLAHSYGSTFIQQVGDVLAAKLEQLGLTPEQVKEATSQVLVVNAGPITPPATGRSAFTTVNVINMDDTEVKNSYNSNEALMDLFLKSNLLVNKKNQPLSDGYILSDREAYYPAKPLNILPIKTTADRRGFHFKRDEGSNQWLACASQPLMLNGFGDIINVRTIPHHEISDERAVFSDKPPVSRDETSHQPISYFHVRRRSATASATAPSEHEEHNSTMRTLMSSVLMNGMNNAVDNMHEGEFKPLARADELMQLPKRVEYIAALNVPLHRVAMLDKYDKKLAGGLDPNRPEPAAQAKS